MPETVAPPSYATAYFLHAQATDPALQNAQLSLNLGELRSVTVLQAAWQQLVGSHRILRSGFSKSSNGETVQRIAESGKPSWALHDWKDVPIAEIPARWNTLLEADAAQPFDPANPPLLRFQAIELPGGHCHQLISFPKLLLDEDTLFHLLCEWLEALDGVTPAADDESDLVSPPVPAVAEWWTRFHAQNATSTEFTIYPRPAATTEITRLQTPEHLLSREASRDFKALCQRLSIAPRDAFLAIWSLVLSRLTASERATFLASDANDTAENILPCHPPLDQSRSVEAWLKDVAKSETERARNSAIGLKRCLLLADPVRTLEDFSAAFFWSHPSLNDRLHDALPRWINADAKLVTHSQFPLSLHLRDGLRIALQIEADPSHCPASEANALLERVTKIAEDILANPSQKVSALDILTASERSALACPAPESSDRSGLSLEKEIAIVARRHAEISAIVGPGDADLTYDDLDAHASALASWLHTENVANGWNIAVCLTPTSWLPVALLGILRAGDTCVPLDPRSSTAWITSRIAPSDVELIICDSETKSIFEGSPHRLLVLDQDWETISAATGNAKSEIAPIAFLLNGTETDEAPALRSLTTAFVASACDEARTFWALEPGDRIGLQAAAGTGAFVETLMVGLLSGATVVLPNPSDTLQLIDPETPALTHLRLSVDQWRVLSARAAGDPSVIPDSLRTICIEATSARLGPEAAWTTLQESPARGILFYSPAGLSGAAIRMEDAHFPTPLTVATLPIGRPTPGLKADLLDSAGHPLPPHHAGTLKITFPDEESESYALSAWRDASGAFHLPAPETDATERALRQLPDIIDVHCAGSAPFAWAVLASGAEPPLPAAIRQATQHLPTELRPDFFEIVDAFPLTLGGTIQTDALPQPAVAQKTLPPSPADEPAPASPAQISRPAKLWDPLVLLYETADAPTLFLIHDLDGSPAPYQALAKLLKSDWTIHGTTARGLQDASACHLTVETEAAALVEAICLLDPDGPFHLVGHGFGAILAMEMARQLRVAARQVPYLVLTGTEPPPPPTDGTWKRALSRFFARPATEAPTLSKNLVVAAHQTALKNFQAKPLPGPAGIILGADRTREAESAWRQCVPEAAIKTINAPAAQMLTDPPVKRIAVLMREWMIPSSEEEES